MECAFKKLDGQCCKWLCECAGDSCQDRLSPELLQLNEKFFIYGQIPVKVEQVFIPPPGFDFLSAIGSIRRFPEEFGGSLCNLTVEMKIVVPQLHERMRNVNRDRFGEFFREVRKGAPYVLKSVGGIISSSTVRMLQQRHRVVAVPAKSVSGVIMRHRRGVECWEVYGGELLDIAWSEEGSYPLHHFAVGE